MSAGAREQVDRGADLRPIDRALRRVERGDRGERIGLGAEVGATDRAVVDIPFGLRSVGGAGQRDRDVLGDRAPLPSSISTV